MAIEDLCVIIYLACVNADIIYDIDLCSSILLRGFVMLKKSKNPRKTRKWVGGSNPNSDFNFFGNFVFFVLFSCFQLFPKK